MSTLHSHSSTTLLEQPRRRKRSFHDFLHPETRAESPSSSSPRLRFSITPSPLDLPSMSRPAPLPPRRVAGDGFDYRRPVMSTGVAHEAIHTPTPTPDVIDLTNDSDASLARSMTRGTSAERRVSSSQFPARRHHNQPRQRRHDARPAMDVHGTRGPVIDLENLDFGVVAPPPDPDESLMLNDRDFLESLLQQSPSSPGFEITGERSVLDDPPRRNIAERRPTPYVSEEEQAPSEVPQLPPPLFQNLPHGLASWIARAGSRITGGDRAGRAEPTTSHEGLRINRIPYSYTPVPEYNSRTGWHPQPQVQLPRLPALDAFQRPRLNYEAQGFELIGAAHSSPPPRSSSPYKAPRAATQGFTRKVEEDDMVVCPHCGDELGTGDNDLKQQIWVVKQCGHVFCGECAMNRHVGRSKKMAPQVHGKPEPFKTCVVRDCKKPVTSKTALFQVYL